MSFTHPFTRLSETEPLPQFDCGDDDLNQFFSNDALTWQSELMAVTYILEDEGKAVLYFSLSNDKISANTLPKSFWRKIKKKFPHPKHRGDYPAVKIGRFAVDKEYRQKPERWGSGALDIIKEWMVSDNKTGCCFITVDAYPSAVPFYLKNSFRFLGNEEELRYRKWEEDNSIETTFAMYFNLKSITKL